MAEYPRDRLYSQMQVWGQGCGENDSDGLYRAGDRVKVGFTAVVNEVAAGKPNLVMSLPEIDSTHICGDIFGYLGWGYEGDDDYNDEGFELCMPVDGRITVLNSRVIDNPDLVLDDPYGEGWLFELEVTGYDATTDLLMEADDYAAYVAQIENS
ncbi:hypothetical protein [Nocardia sp. NPDC003963]